MFAALNNAFKGDEKLLVAFWFWGILGNFFLLLVFFVIAILLRGKSEVTYLIPINFGFLQFIYFICSMIMIWRCAHNVDGNKGWAYIARFFVINSPIMLFLIIVFEYFLLVGLGL